MLPLVGVHGAAACRARGAIVNFDPLPIDGELSAAEEAEEALLALASPTVAVEGLRMTGRAHDGLDSRHRV